MVVFPQSDNDTMGIEDLRMVKFVEEDESVSYYGTYTAFNGSHALPQLMTTKDFHHLQMHTLNGDCVQNKGFALFPRRIGGHYCMCSRIDGENLFMMFSDVVEFWESATLLQVPEASLGVHANRQLWFANRNTRRLVTVDARGGSDANLLYRCDVAGLRRSGQSNRTSRAAIDCTYA